MKTVRHGIFFIVFIGIFLYLARIPILEKVAFVLKLDNASKGADAMVILSGDPLQRVPKAVRLHKENYAKKIIIIDTKPSRQNKLEEMGYKLPHPSLLTIQLLQKEGIREDDIIRIPKAQAASTVEEAKILRQFSGNDRFKKLILVTTTYHTARAYWIFKKIFKDSNIQIEIAAADHSDFNEKNWWQSENGFITYFNEYLKWIYYLTHY